MADLHSLRVMCDAGCMAALEAEHFLSEHEGDVKPPIPEAQWEPMAAKQDGIHVADAMREPALAA